MRGLAGLVVAVACLSPGAAHAGDWVHKPPGADEKAFQDWRWSASTGLWIGTYSRLQSACAGNTTFGLRPAALRAAQFIPFGCPYDASEEVGMSAAADVSYRVFSPLHLTLGLELLYTQPAYDAVRNQVGISLPFGLLVTWYEWALRPIVHFTITPMILLPDGKKDYTLGGNLGLAYRILEFGDVSLTVGRHWSGTVDPWIIRIGLHPL